MKIWKLGLIVSSMGGVLAAGSGTALSQDRLIRGGEPVRGFPDAPVTLVEFCDFQCPYCAETRIVLEQLFAAHPRDIKVVYRNYPVERLHADAGRAAEAAMCAQEQGRFWDMSNSMFANQKELDLSGLLRQAGDLGLDTRAFADCLETGRHRADWRRDQADGTSLGVSATPSFFVNGTFHEGGTFDALDGLIRAALVRGSAPGQ
jgi:protein-disulfide isomerase